MNDSVNITSTNFSCGSGCDNIIRVSVCSRAHVLKGAPVSFSSEYIQSTVGTGDSPRATEGLSLPLTPCGAPQAHGKGRETRQGREEKMGGNMQGVRRRLGQT